MKLGELLNCSAPLLAEHPGEGEYPYWFGGSCFRVRDEDNLYIVTAAHCLRDKSKDEVRVQRHPGSRYFLTLTALLTQRDEARHKDDPDQDDWAVLRAVEPPADHSDHVGPALDLSTIPRDELSHSRERRLVIRGYPKVLSAINYEGCGISWRAFAGTGAYLGRTSWSKLCHTMLLDNVSEIESIDGLSGSPIFSLTPTGPAYHASFAGMALRGSRESGLLHFLDSSVVCAALAMARKM